MAEGEVKIRLSAEDRASGAISKVTGAIKTMVVAYLGIKGINLVIGEMKKCIDASMEQEKASISLVAALKSQGIFTEELRQKMENYAGALQNVTTYGDEAIVSAQALLVRMGVAPALMDRTTKATLDWAAALGKDLKSASLDLGKAASGNVMMLQRYGVKISEAELKTKGFEAVLDALEKKFGGTAEAMGNTFQGRLMQINNLIGDLKEKIGDAIVINQTWREILAFVVEKLQLLNTWLANNKEQIQDWSSNAGLAFINFGRTSIDILLDVGTALAAIGKSLAQVGELYLKVSEAVQPFKKQREELGELKELIVDVRDGFDTFGITLQTAKEHVGTMYDALENRLIPTFGKTVEVLAGDGAGGGTGINPELERLKKNLDGLKPIELLPEDKRSPVKTMASDIQTILDSSGVVIDDTEDKVDDMKSIFDELGEVLRNELLQPFIDLPGLMMRGQLTAEDFFATLLKGVAKLAMNLILPGFGNILSIFGFNKGGLVPAFQHGGMVMGPGGYDRVPARLTSGEFVMQKSAVDRIGVNALNSLNRGGDIGSINVTVNMTSTGKANYDAMQLGNELAKSIKDLKRRRKI